MTKIKVSVLIANYNNQKYIKESIDSINRQTYKNIEYIIVDGGSTDGTIDIIKKNIEYIDYFVIFALIGLYINS